MRILFLDTVHPVLEERLSAAGHHCEHDYSCSYDELLMRIADFEGLVLRSRIPIDRTLLQSARKLRFVARSGSGLENIDLVAAEEFGIEVISSPEGNRVAVGEHAIGMLLMLLNHLKRADAEVRAGLWRREANRGQELASRTVGIIGYGQMGSAFAERLSGFGCRVLLYDKYRTLHPAGKAEHVSLQTLQKEADVISLHLPLSEETRHYVNREFIAACSKPFILINTSRGNQVDSEALLDGLDSGAIEGACLDVLEFETSSFEALGSASQPAAFQRLVADERVLFSPHVAGWTEESYLKLSEVLASKILNSFGSAQ